MVSSGFVQHKSMKFESKGFQGKYVKMFVVDIVLKNRKNGELKIDSKTEWMEWTTECIV